MGKLAVLNTLTGGLSNPSKMPGHAYSLPARECLTGSKLRSVSGSVCHGCYAMKGRYVFPNVQAALYRRLATIDSAEWVGAMAELITHYSSEYFRWHDSGDLQSVSHLDKIVQVCRLTPNTQHWLPTREYRMVREWLAVNECPPNLNIRLSAHMIGGHVPAFRGIDSVTVSTVTDEDVTDGTAHNCPSRHQGNQCGACRACWQPTVKRVNYIRH